MPANGAGVTVNAPGASYVVLRGLTVDGAGANTTGILFSAAVPAAHIDHCVINRVITGISAALNNNTNLFVNDSVIRSILIGLSVSSTGPAVEVSVERARIEDNATAGVSAGGFGVKATIRDSILAGNGTAVSTLAGADVNVENSVLMANNTGISAAGGSVVRAAATMISQNATGLTGTGARCSFGNNRLHGNGMNGTFSDPMVTAACAGIGLQ